MFCSKQTVHQIRKRAVLRVQYWTARATYARFCIRMAPVCIRENFENVGKLLLLFAALRDERKDQKPDRKARHAVKRRYTLFPSHRENREPTLLKRYSGRIKLSELLHNLLRRLQRVPLHHHRGI